MTELWLSSAHIAGKTADFESRNFRQENEWMLDKKVFQDAISQLNFKPEIGLFASRSNCQIKKFVSWKPEPESYAIDAFFISWTIKFVLFSTFQCNTNSFAENGSGKSKGDISDA